MQLKLLRALVVALSVLLPLQGIAAVTAGMCMAFAHDVEESHHDANEHHGDHGHAEADHQGNAGHCGPCTACCASASISGPIATFTPAPPQAAIDPLPEFFPPGRAPARLYRPPLAL